MLLPPVRNRCPTLPADELMVTTSTGPSSKLESQTLPVDKLRRTCAVGVPCDEAQADDGQPVGDAHHEEACKHRTRVGGLIDAAETALHRMSSRSSGASVNRMDVGAADKCVIARAGRNCTTWSQVRTA